MRGLGDHIRTQTYILSKMGNQWKLLSTENQEIIFGPVKWRCQGGYKFPGFRKKVAGFIYLQVIKFLFAPRELLCGVVGSLESFLVSIPWSGPPSLLGQVLYLYISQSRCLGIQSTSAGKTDLSMPELHMSKDVKSRASTDMFFCQDHRGILILIFTFP